MISKWFKLFAAISILAMLIPTSVIAQTPTAPQPAKPVLKEGLVVTRIVQALDLDKAIKTEDGRVRIIVELSEPPLAQYNGGQPGLAPTSVQATGSQQLDVSVPASQAYINHLKAIQKDFIGRLANTAPSATVDYTYQAAMNGLAMAVKPEEANGVRKMTGVRTVFPDQLQFADLDASVNWIHAPSFWTDLGGRSQAGKGIFVAVIDTGVWSSHPMFSGTGFTPPGKSYPHSFCTQHPTDPDFQCNNKLVAAQVFTPTFPITDTGMIKPVDLDGHGSHIAGIAVGDPATVPVGSIVPANTEISGVAPAAYLIVYKALFYTKTGQRAGSDSSLIAALNAALIDGANVVNNSWGNAAGDPNQVPQKTAIESLVSSGITVVFSAGNNGPFTGTITCPGCIEDVITVAASTTFRRYSKALDVTGPTPVPSNLLSLEMQYGSGSPQISTDLSAPIKWIPSDQPWLDVGCDPYPADWFKNSIALIMSGVCSPTDKVNNAGTNGGAIAAIVFNADNDNLYTMVVNGTTIPSYFMGKTNGTALRDYILANPDTTTARINFIGRKFDVTPDVLATFSSAGPNGDPDVLKPDITAPGVDILSAYSPANGQPNYAELSGTSMAAPHIAGAAALMKQLHPLWTPAQIKSALTSTTVQTVLQLDGVTQAGPLRMGAGRVDLDRARAAGLTFDKPSFAKNECFLTCEWTRSVKNETNSTVIINVAKQVFDPGLILTVTPSQLTLAAGETKTFKLTAEVSGLTLDNWSFGGIGWIPTQNEFPPAVMPLAVRPVASTDYATLTKTAPAEVRDSTPFTYTMKLANTAYGSSTTYQFHDTLPNNIDYVNGSAQGGLVYDPGTRSLSASVSLNAPALNVNSSASPHGYVALEDLGAQPAPCGLSSCDDVVLNMSGTGVNFYYLGKQYTSVGVSSNGFIIPGGMDSNFPYKVPQNFPDPTTPNNVIAPLWTDLDLTSGSGGGKWYVAWVGYQDGTSYLVAEWSNAQHFGDPTSIYSFEIWVEWGTGNIWFVYATLGGVNALTYPISIGEENAEGNLGTSYFYKKDTGTPGVGTPPVVGTDLQLNNVIDALTMTFQAIAPFKAPYKVINIATLTNSHNILVVSSEATTNIKRWTTSLPIVVKNKAGP